MGYLKKRKTEEKAKHLSTCANSWVEATEVCFSSIVEIPYVSSFDLLMLICITLIITSKNVYIVIAAKEIAELWREYEENSSPEAKVVKDFDKVELILQALEYEQGNE